MAQRDQYPSRGALNAAREWFAITPGTDELVQVPRALWVGTGGNISLKAGSADPVTLMNVPNGYMLPVSPTHVLAAGTTASNIVGLV